MLDQLCFQFNPYKPEHSRFTKEIRFLFSEQNAVPNNFRSNPIFFQTTTTKNLSIKS